MSLSKWLSLLLTITLTIATIPANASTSVENTFASRDLRWIIDQVQGKIHSTVTIRDPSMQTSEPGGVTYKTNLSASCKVPLKTDVQQEIRFASSKTLKSKYFQAMQDTAQEAAEWFLGLYMKVYVKGLKVTRKALLTASDTYQCAQKTEGRRSLAYCLFRAMVARAGKEAGNQITRKPLPKKVVDQNISALMDIVAPLEEMMKPEMAWYNLAMPRSAGRQGYCKGGMTIDWNKKKELVTIRMVKDCDCKQRPKTDPSVVKNYTVKITAKVTPDFSVEGINAIKWNVSDIKTVFSRGNCCTDPQTTTAGPTKPPAVDGTGDKKPPETDDTGSTDKDEPEVVTAYPTSQAGNPLELAEEEIETDDDKTQKELDETVKDYEKAQGEYGELRNKLSNAYTELGKCQNIQNESDRGDCVYKWEKAIKKLNGEIMDKFNEIQSIRHDHNRLEKKLPEAVCTAPKAICDVLRKKKKK